MTAFRRSATTSLATTSIMAIALAASAGTSAQAQTTQTPPAGSSVAPSVPQPSGGSQAIDAGDRAVAPSSAAVEPKTPPQTVGGPVQGSDQAPAAATQADPNDAGLSSNAPDVLVVGTRASLQSAINRKRRADTVVDSIVADDIASFPDKNVGDALARITGVQLSRDFGEGVKVSIRGVEPDLNRIEINGVSQVSATGERSGDFRELAAELVKSIDVYKGYAANLTEGGLGGTVVVETRKPLDLKAPILALSGSAQYLNLTQDWRPRGTLIAGTNHFLLPGLGALLNVTYSDVSTRQDYASNTNYGRFADFDHSDQKTVADPTYAAFNTYASCAGVGGQNTANATARRLACETQFFDWVPTVPRYRTLVRRDKRLSADLTLQYEIAHNLRAYAEAQINNRSQRLQDTNYSLDISRVERLQRDPQLAAGLNGGTSRPQVALGTSTVDANHVVTSFTTALSTVNIGTAAAPNYNGASNILSVQRRDFSYPQKSQYFNGGFEWNVGRLNVKALGSHAKASTDGTTNLIQISTGVAGITVDDRNSLGIPSFTYPSNVNPADASIYTDLTRRGADGQLLVPSGPTVQYRPTVYENSENQGKIDAIWDVDLPLLKKLEAGVQARWQDYLLYNGGGSRLLTPASGTTPAVYQTSANVSYTTVITNTPPATPAANTYYLTPAQYVALVNANNTVTGGSTLFNGISGGVPSGVPSRLAVPVFNYGTLGQVYDLSGFNNNLVRFANGLPQIPQIQITEKIQAAYLQADLETHIFGMRLTGNAGLRYTRTEDNGTGTNISRQTQFTGTGTAVTTVTLSAQSVTLRNTYNDFLPAFNAALEITPNLVARANWAKNLARPKPADLVPNINCLDDATIAATADTCTAGNPALQPYRADAWEVNLAWYPNRDTLISVDYYKKYEKSFVIQNVTRANVDLFGDGILYTVRQPINGFGALLDGIEVSAQTAFTFLPGFLSGFGVTGNATFARAIRTNLTNSATGQPLTDYPGQSGQTYNASFFYDRGFLNAKISYNYRSDWLETVADSLNGNLPVYRRHEGYIDGKVTFRFPNLHTSLFVEAQNLNNEYSEQFIKNIGVSQVYYPGRRIFLGAQIKF